MQLFRVHVRVDEVHHVVTDEIPPDAPAHLDVIAASDEHAREVAAYEMRANYGAAAHVLFGSTYPVGWEIMSVQRIEDADLGDDPAQIDAMRRTVERAVRRAHGGEHLDPHYVAAALTDRDETDPTAAELARVVAALLEAAAAFEQAAEHQPAAGLAMAPAAGRRTADLYVDVVELERRMEFLCSEIVCEGDLRQSSDRAGDPGSAGVTIEQAADVAVRADRQISGYDPAGAARLTAAQRDEIAGLADAAAVLRQQIAQVAADLEAEVDAAGQRVWQEMRGPGVSDFEINEKVAERRDSLQEDALTALQPAIDDLLLLLDRFRQLRAIAEGEESDDVYTEDVEPIVEV